MPPDGRTACRIVIVVDYQQSEWTVFLHRAGRGTCHCRFVPGHSDRRTDGAAGHLHVAVSPRVAPAPRKTTTLSRSQGRSCRGTRPGRARCRPDRKISRRRIVTKPCDIARAGGLPSLGHDLPAALAGGLVELFNGFQPGQTQYFRLHQSEPGNLWSGDFLGSHSPTAANTTDRSVPATSVTG